MQRNSWPLEAHMDFTLVVDNFGIKYFNKNDVQHLQQAIGTVFKYSTDWPGIFFCGMQFDWNYTEGYVDVSMPNYVEKALKRLGYIPNVPQYSPHQHTPIKYGLKGIQQSTPSPNTSPLLTPKETQWIQSVTGTFLYYARTIDSTLLPALNELASQQAQLTQKTLKKAHQIMDYVHTYPNTYIRYRASDMILNVDSNTAYLVAPKARSCVASYYQLTANPTKTPHPTINGAILVECKTLRHVVSSAAEAETAAIFHNAQQAVPIRIILQALDHQQPPTPVKTDNSTAQGFIEDNIHMKKSKSWDMRYHWLRDRQTQNQFQFYWKTSKDNYADYFTKHHATTHHRQI